MLPGCTHYFQLELGAGALCFVLPLTQDTLGPLRQAGLASFVLTLGPMGAAFDPSLEKVPSQQDMLLEPPETQSLLEPLGVCAQSGGFSPLLGAPRGLA